MAAIRKNALALPFKANQQNQPKKETPRTLYPTVANFGKGFV